MGGLRGARKIPSDESSLSWYSYRADFSIEAIACNTQDYEVIAGIISSLLTRLYMPLSSVVDRWIQVI